MSPYLNIVSLNLILVTNTHSLTNVVWLVTVTMKNTCFNTFGSVTHDQHGWESIEMPCNITRILRHVIITVRHAAPVHGIKTFLKVNFCGVKGFYTSLCIDRTMAKWITFSSDAYSWSHPLKHLCLHVNYEKSYSAAVSYRHYVLS